VCFFFREAHNNTARQCNNNEKPEDLLKSTVADHISEKSETRKTHGNNAEQ